MRPRAYPRVPEPTPRPPTRDAPVDGDAADGRHYSPPVPDVLLATDADWIADEIDAALAGPGTAVRRLRRGVDVLPAIDEHEPDLIILDLQIGNMGGMAACMAVRLEESAGRLDRLPVMMLLDRSADLFLARRSDADGWLLKPLDAFRLRRAADALLAGDQYHDRVGTEDAMGEADAADAP